MAEISGFETDARSPLVQCRAKAYPLKLARAVWRHEHPGPNLAERRGLFIDRYAQALREQRIGREQTANSAAHDRNMEPITRHHCTAPLLRPIACVDFTNSGFRRLWKAATDMPPMLTYWTSPKGASVASCANFAFGRFAAKEANVRAICRARLALRMDQG